MSMLFGSLHCLRTLTVTSFVLRAEVFVALSQLPCLKTLSISSKLEENSFLSLQNLHLHGIEWETLVNLCKVKSLEKALRSAQGGSPSSSSTSPSRNPLLDYLSILIERSSPVSHLLLSYSPYDNWMDEILSRRLFSRLHLTHLTTSHLLWRELGLNWFDLLHDVPALDSLRIAFSHYANAFELRELRSFATLLPRLTHLMAPVGIGSVLNLGPQDYISNLRNFGDFNLEMYYVYWNPAQNEWPPNFRFAMHIEDIARFG
ncbi:LRR receptor-like serine/threonine-protein kinase [Rhizoctonia solani]|uniref:LRR receptor-like serine/threonine-protein kinase n=1 Tax=Rhizoctonia solani TaxID=456999 RepID=A0A8H8SVQ0_9AGAM|nr:LRR receptor-like serine/threonine-protein kinase [Rhizoctonia solani]QRW18687.1 LRR receptor-like serine/threonine-protein kinase [Rhizoctonia solani]